jgi:ribosome-binding protein aMBF1 (putative translation factor)
MPRVKMEKDVEMGEVYAAQCRAGRAILGWTRDQMAEETGLSEALIKKYEGNGPWTVSATAVIRETFRKYGIRVEIDDAGTEYLIARKIKQTEKKG